MSFWTIFCPFTLFFYPFLIFCPFLKTWKIKIWKKWKRHLEISSFYKSTKKHNHMLHCSWDTAHDRCNFYFSFWAMFCPFTPPKDTKNQNFEKMNKTPGDIIILHMCTKNYDHKIYSSWDMVCNRWMDRLTDGWMDRQKKWHIEVGAPPKKTQKQMAIE